MRNRLELDESGAFAPSPTDEHETLPGGIVFRSVGYRGVELPGVPFDERSGTVPNERGRVGSPASTAPGWIKRGPSGVIGTNKKDATETVELLLEDLRDGPRKDRAPDEIEALLAERGVRSSSIRAGRRSTSSSAPRARSSAGRGSSSSPGTSCSRPRLGQTQGSDPAVRSASGAPYTDAR